MTELAAFESERIGEQWKEVHERRRRHGLPGGGKLPYGWRYQDGAVVPHPDQAPAVAAMYELYLAGFGARHIARWLEQRGHLTYSGSTKWAYSSVTQTLDSAFHAGFVIHKGQLSEGAHAGIIDEETWRRYTAVRRERANERSVKHRYLLSGIASCVTCGEPMYGFTIDGRHGHRTASAYFGYRCRSVSTNPEHGPGTMSARVVDRIVVDWLATLAREIEVQMPGDIDDHAKLDAARIAREVAALDRQVVSLTEGLASGLVPERAYRATVEGIESKRAALMAALQDAEDRIVLRPTDPAGTARTLIDDWDLLPLDAKRQGLRELLLSIDVNCQEPRNVSVRPRWGSPVVTNV